MNFKINLNFVVEMKLDHIYYVDSDYLQLKYYCSSR